MALETLIMRRACWSTGYGYEWIDKKFGFKRRVRRFDQRAVEHELDIEDLLVRGSKDPSVFVRRVVAQALIDLRLSLSPAIETVGKVLAEDKAPSVRSRADYYLSKSTAG